MQRTDTLRQEFKQQVTTRINQRKKDAGIFYKFK